MLAKALNATPEWVMWHLPFDRGLVYQHAILRAQDAWTVAIEPPEAPVSEEEIDELMEELDCE